MVVVHCGTSAAMDDMTLGELKRRKEADGADSDSDDDLTLADILGKINTGKKKTKKKKEKKKAAPKPAASKKRSREPAAKSSRKKAATSTVASDTPLSTGNPTFKHEIVEKLLCRWKYALPGWPLEPPPTPKVRCSLALPFALFACFALHDVAPRNVALRRTKGVPRSDVASLRKTQAGLHVTCQTSHEQPR